MLSPSNTLPQTLSRHAFIRATKYLGRLAKMLLTILVFLKLPNLKVPKSGSVCATPTQQAGLYIIHVPRKERLFTGWTDRGSNPGESEVFRTRPDRAWGPPSLLYRDTDKSLARTTSRCILFDGENISFDVSLVTYIHTD